jgi:hypothetical protein
MAEELSVHSQLSPRSTSVSASKLSICACRLLRKVDLRATGEYICGSWQMPTGQKQQEIGIEENISRERTHHIERR